MIWYIGVRRTPNGKLFTQVVREYPEKLKTTKWLAVRRVTASSQLEKAEKELIEAVGRGISTYEPKSPRADFFGRVGYHSDGGRTHTVICVGEAMQQCCVLFLTSHPSWNPYARPLTTDEAGMVGHPRKGIPTYLAPVLRPEDEIHWSDLYLTEHRIQALREEFFADVSRVACF